jgi:hypothetical protein
VSVESTDGTGLVLGVPDALRRAERLSTTVPWLRRHHGERLVVVVSGPVRTAFAQDLALLWQVGVRSVVVHDRWDADEVAEFVRAVGACGSPAVGLTGEVAGRPGPPVASAVGAVLDTGHLPVVPATRDGGTTGLARTGERIAGEVGASLVVLMTPQLTSPPPARYGRNAESNGPLVTQVQAGVIGLPHPLLTHLLLNQA